jgi:hypothetical protein
LKGEEVMRNREDEEERKEWWGGAEVVLEGVLIVYEQLSDPPVDLQERMRHQELLLSLPSLLSLQQPIQLTGNSLTVVRTACCTA